MSAQRRIEIFSAGCAVCEEPVAVVTRLACPSCDVAVLDMHDPAVAARAKNYGVGSVPAVVVDGRLAACCMGGGPDEASLRAAGVGLPLP
jgi:glutaredoxin 3